MKAINFSELSWATRDRWPKELKYGVCLLIILVLYYLFHYFIIRPTNNQVDLILGEETRLKQEYEKKYGQIINLKVYEKQLAEMNQRFGMLLKQLPTTNEMPALLEDISKTGVASGLTFELFAPSKIVEHPYYIELPVNISVIGTYQQMATFINRVAKISRVVTIHNFTITSAAVNKTAIGLDKSATERLMMNITIKIYQYRVL